MVGKTNNFVFAVYFSLLNSVVLNESFCLLAGSHKNFSKSQDQLDNHSGMSDC